MFGYFLKNGYALFQGACAADHGVSAVELNVQKEKKEGLGGEPGLVLDF